MYKRQLLAFALRVVALADVPPGWRDDELIETLVISRNILGGDLRFYYPDASGHEALYHALNALFLAWFGPGALGIRLLSAFLGTLAVPLTYALGRRLFGPAVGLTAAALLAVSFWGLMYSRVGIRHVMTPTLALAAFYFFWQSLGPVSYTHLDVYKRQYPEIGQRALQEIAEDLKDIAIVEQQPTLEGWRMTLTLSPEALATPKS